MDDRLIRLSNGQNMKVNINFYTTYLMNDLEIQERYERLSLNEERYSNLSEDERKSKKGKEIKKRIDKQTGDLARDLIYIIVRSNGKEVTKEEAMMLMPPDADGIQEVFEAFSQKMEIFKKKETSKIVEN